jgi:hypothetical protein
MCQFLVVGEVEGDRELGWLDYVFSLVGASTVSVPKKML